MQKFLLCLLFVTVYTAVNGTVLIPVRFGDRGYTRFIKFPDGKGIMRNVDLEAEPDIEFLSLIKSKPGNKYLLFTRGNPKRSQTLTINNADSIINSNFNAHVPTVVIVHGWLSDQYTAINPTIRDAYLSKSDVNIIVVDWSRLAKSDYVTATIGVPPAGRHLGQFLAFLNRVTCQSYAQMHLIGFSLGAHFVGNAGRELEGRVARITALDPAGPLWKDNTNRVRPSDAIYVESIHTNAGHLGIDCNVGDTDFYPNGGMKQPGCLTDVCKHNRAWQLFAATVTFNNFIGRQCASKTQLILNKCFGAPLNMGNDDLRKTGYGMYRLDTGSKYPY